MRWRLNVWAVAVALLIWLLLLLLLLLMMMMMMMMMMVLVLVLMAWTWVWQWEWWWTREGASATGTLQAITTVKTILMMNMRSQSSRKVTIPCWHGLRGKTTPNFCRFTYLEWRRITHVQAMRQTRPFVFPLANLSMQSTEPPSGYINATEFIAPLSRWVHDSKTAPRFIKYNLQPLVVKTVERNMKKQCLVPPKRRACWTCSTWNILLLHFLLKYLVKWIYCEVDMSCLCDHFSLAVRRTMNQQEELYVYCQDDGWFKNANSRLSAEKGHLCQLASFQVHAEFKRTRSSKCAHDCPWVFGQKPFWQPAQCPGISSTMDLKRQHCLPKWPFMSFIKKLQDAFNAMVDRLDDLGDRLVA